MRSDLKKKKPKHNNLFQTWMQFQLDTKKLAFVLLAFGLFLIFYWLVSVTANHQHFQEEAYSC